MVSENLLLLRGGHVIDVEHGTATFSTDVLIDGARIVAIGRDLDATGATVIDASRQIVLPGFVDVHRHTWQTAVRASAIDVDLRTYLERVLGRFGSRFTAEHVRAATLAGSLEALDAGVTTLFDYAHALHTPAHTDAAVDALEESGLRAVFGYGFPMVGDRDVQDVRRIRSRLADDEARTTMALAPVGPSFTPIETVRDDWRIADELGLRISFHVSAGPVAERPVTALQEAGLLHERLLFIHGHSLADTELSLIAAAGASVGSTPAAEAQMTGGRPVIGRLRAAGMRPALGVDSVSSAPGDPFSSMRAALIGSQIADARPLTAAETLRMATLDGAAALGLDQRTGSLTVGKQADIVLLRLDDLNMLAAEHDPVGAVVASAHPGNVDTVIVGGQIVKSSGRLHHPGRVDLLSAVHAAAAAVTA